jgi:EmrB/QacA subfamily drug resistance transporter
MARHARLSGLDKRRADGQGSCAPAGRTTNRLIVTGAVMVGTFMAAVEVTIVATAMPTIVGSLGGFAYYAWVFSAFLLAQAVTIPIYGKLADTYGRRPVFIAGTLVFLAGSVLAGLAPTMLFLVASRAMQGLGAGAILPIATTIIGDLYTLEERVKIQGYLNSVWGISAVTGPALGGLIVQTIGWPWIFFLNVPIGLLAIVGLVLALHEEVRPQRHRLDIPGALTLVIAIGALLLALLEGGSAWPWLSLPSAGLLLLAGLALAFFLRWEARAAEPIVPLAVLRNRVILIADAAVLASGGLVLGVTSFVPAFVQGVLGASPAVAGFTLTTLSIGWPLASAFTGVLALRIGFRPTALLGSLCTVLASLMFLVLVRPGVPPVLVALASFVMGVGMGLSSTAFLVAIQDAVTWERRGVATGSFMFARLIGSSIGVALLGAVLNAGIRHYLVGSTPLMEDNRKLDVAGSLLEPAWRASLSPEVVATLQTALVAGLRWVYLVVLCLALLGTAITWFFPGLRRSCDNEP